MSDSLSPLWVSIKFCQATNSEREYDDNGGKKICKTCLSPDPHRVHVYPSRDNDNPGGNPNERRRMKVKPSNRMRQGRGRGGVVIEMGPKDVQLPADRPKVKAGTSALPVFKLKRILVPLDFSDCSKKALQYAVAFARQFGATLSLLYVIQPYYPVSEMVPMDGELFDRHMRESSETEMSALRKSLDPALKPSATIRYGTPHVEIVRAARDLKCDVIILSTHGRTGLSHVLMGSTAERVVRHANCPVLVLREREREFVKG